MYVKTLSDQNLIHNYCKTNQVLSHTDQILKCNIKTLIFIINKIHLCAGVYKDINDTKILRL